MNIISAQFVKGILGSDPALENNFPQVAFVGRSNAGKSSLINSLVKQKNLARTSNTPGRTQQINLFLINDNCYFLDLPGYGYAKASKNRQAELGSLIRAYLFVAKYEKQKIVQVIDAAVGPTELDLEILRLLEEHEKDILIVANKFDKVKKTAQKKQLETIQKKVGKHKIVAYSSKENIGRSELLHEIL